MYIRVKIQLSCIKILNSANASTNWSLHKIAAALLAVVLCTGISAETNLAYSKSLADQLYGSSNARVKSRQKLRRYQVRYDKYGFRIKPGTKKHSARKTKVRVRARSKVKETRISRKARAKAQAKAKARANAKAKAKARAKTRAIAKARANAKARAIARATLKRQENKKQFQARAKAKRRPILNNRGLKNWALKNNALNRKEGKNNRATRKLSVAWIPAHNKYRTMCVRVKDGFYWPISFAAKKSQLMRDQIRCKRSCMSEVRLFFGRSPGKSIEIMRDLNGNSYKKMKNAFRYRKEYVADAACKPKPWSLAAKQRHKFYASPGAFTSTVNYLASVASEAGKQLLANQTLSIELKPENQKNDQKNTRLAKLGSKIQQLKPSQKTKIERKTVAIAQVKKTELLVEKQISEMAGINEMFLWNDHHFLGAANIHAHARLKFSTILLRSHRELFAHTNHQYLRRRKKNGRENAKAEALTG